MACSMTATSWGPEKDRMASEGTEMDCARELNRGRCADMWVSPQMFLCSSLYPVFCVLI